MNISKKGGFTSKHNMEDGWEAAYVLLVKLVAPEGGDAGFDSSGAESDKDQPDHGQSAARQTNQIRQRPC